MHGTPHDGPQHEFIGEFDLFRIGIGPSSSHTVGPLRAPSQEFQRGADQLNYVCHQDTRLMLVATPSGVTLAPESGSHQSIATQLVGMAEDGLAYFEPAFADDLAVVMRWAFDYMQRDGEGTPSERNWLRDETGGSVYLRLSSHALEQPIRTMNEELARDVVDGSYWLRRPEPNAQVVIAFIGAVAPEAMEAVGLPGKDRSDVGLLAVTSADRLQAGWSAAQKAHEWELDHARSYVERLLDAVPSHCAFVTVLDGHPTALGWLGSLVGHRTRALGVEHFGQTVPSPTSIATTASMPRVSRRLRRPSARPAVRHLQAV